MGVIIEERGKTMFNTNRKPMFAAGNQGDQDDDSANEGANPTIEEIADEEFEEVESDDDEDGEEVEPGSSADDEGEQDEDGADDGDEAPAGKAGEPPKRKWAGEFETPEELEAHYIQSLKGKQEPPKEEREQAIPDLTDTELNTMSEQDEQDGTAFVEQYLRTKMQERNLEKHEIFKLRQIDTDKGTDLLGDYHEMRAARAARREMAPLARKTQEENQRIFADREKKIDESNKEEFGASLKTLEEYCSQPKNVEAVLKNSSIAHLIVSELERSPALAHKLLLREAATFQRVSKEGKRVEKSKKSVRADAGASKPERKSGSTAATVEDAWEQAEAEQDNE